VYWAGAAPVSCWPGCALLTNHCCCLLHLLHLLQDVVQGWSVDVCWEASVRLHCAAVPQPQCSSSGSSRVCSGTPETWRSLPLEA
jgi:hypothetical protein